ncbi:MAG: carbohydrate-binding family 9-like protein [Bryobacteraceae bacterium]|jgi:hypothetical protein
MHSLLAFLLFLAAADPAAVLESAFSSRDFEPTADPKSELWSTAPRVTADRDYLGQPIPGQPTEIRARWSDRYLYLLFLCPYDELNLKPDPNPAAETPALWNWDVAEAFIGSDFDHIGRYKELQVSPRGEWVDLDIDRDSPKTQQGMAWNSGYTVRGRIDAPNKVWFGEMRIPFSAILTKEPPSPREGLELRIGLFRIAGAGQKRNFYAWRPPAAKSFHVPQAFGILRLRNP